MSPRRLSALLALPLAAALAVATPAEAAPTHPVAHAHSVPTPLRATPKPRVGAPAGRKLDLAKVRGLAKPRPARRALRALSAGRSVDMRILLVTATGDEAKDPAYGWWKSALTREGVPFETFVAKERDLTPESLQVSEDHGRFQGVVLSDASLAAFDPTTGTWPSAFTEGEWQILQAYEARFGVREIAAVASPQPAIGMSWPRWADCGDPGGSTARVTQAGAHIFSELVGAIPVDRGSHTCPGDVVAGSGLQTQVAAADGSPMVATITRPVTAGDGTVLGEQQQMVNLVNTNQWMLHGRLMFGGMLRWVTQGVHAGLSRNYLNVDVDDVLLSSVGWDVANHRQFPAGVADIRMTADDVTRAVNWQQANGLRLNLLYNGAGADTTTAKGRPNDPLTAALLANKAAFRWTSHTWEHLFMASPMTQKVMEEQIRKNITFASRNKLPGFDPDELVTGEHSGTTTEDPALIRALANTGVTWIGADASRPGWAAQRAFGSANSVPRTPTDIYYNVATREQQLDEYNTIYGTDLTWEQYVARQVEQIVPRILGNDPRPFYVHQANLARDGVFYSVFDQVLARYRSLVRTPVTQLGMSDLGTAMQRAAQWQSAVANGQASVTLTPTSVVVRSDVPGLYVPLTGTSAGAVHDGIRSDWVQVPAGETTIQR